MTTHLPELYKNKSPFDKFLMEEKVAEQMICARIAAGNFITFSTVDACFNDARTWLLARDEHYEEAWKSFLRGETSSAE